MPFDRICRIWMQTGFRNHFWNWFVRMSLCKFGRIFIPSFTIKYSQLWLPSIFWHGVNCISLGFFVLFIYHPYKLVHSKGFPLNEKCAISECKTDLEIYVLGDFLKHPYWLNAHNVLGCIQPFFHGTKCISFYVWISIFLQCWPTQKYSLFLTKNYHIWM